MGMRENLENMLASGRDTALLRFSLGELYLRERQPAAAAEHLRKAVEYDPDYSAAWKLYGRALADAGEPAAAIEAFDHGIAAAERGGDNQAAKEMRVFRKRLEKTRGE